MDALAPDDTIRGLGDSPVSSLSHISRT